MNPTKGTILVVDDELAVLATVRDGLTAHGYEVLTASGGADALQVAQAHDGAISVVLVDVVMPGMNGPEVVQQLHQTRQK
jgi:CheY-like chemotaxis protein